MTGTDDMQLPRKAAKLEWNLNTIINLMTLIGMLAGGIYIWANTTRDIEDLKKWRMRIITRRGLPRREHEKPASTNVFAPPNSLPSASRPPSKTYRPASTSKPQTFRS
jgi:hypothetical protein